MSMMQRSAIALLRNPTALRRPVAQSLVAHLQARPSVPSGSMYHASSSRSEQSYVPGGPIVRGTVNDATTYPPPAKSHGSYHWAFERILSASLVPIMGAAVVTSGSTYALIDALLGVSLVMHSYIGFESIRIDYLHPRKWPVIGPITNWTVKALTGLSVYGIFMFNTNDIGFVELVTKLWHA